MQTTLNLLACKARDCSATQGKAFTGCVASQAISRTIPSNTNKLLVLLVGKKGYHNKRKAQEGFKISEGYSNKRTKQVEQGCKTQHVTVLCSNNSLVGWAQNKLVNLLSN